MMEKEKAKHGNKSKLRINIFFKNKNNYNNNCHNNGNNNGGNNNDN